MRKPMRDVRRLLRIAKRAGACLLLFAWSAAAQSAKPVKLECESLITPLGMDAAKPQLSWKMEDNRVGARQTAYQIQVASKAELLARGKSDVWDSGKVESASSQGVIYGGPAFEPSKRYYWRVLVWDKDGKAGAPSAPSWWETGLLQQENWKAKWIGYEEPELRQVRESGAEWITNADGEAPKDATSTKHDFRLHFDLTKPVRRAVLYLTGEDSAGAWINGKQVMEAAPLTPWRQMPWKTYAFQDVRGALHAGRNALAIEVVRYGGNNGGANHPSQTPMSAVLYVEAADGTVELFKSAREGWRARLNAEGDWQAAEFDDSSWTGAVPYVMPSSGFENAELGNPWPTGAVKSLRRTFEVPKPVASARIYAPALGSYQLSINGRRVGNEILAPGWTDFRERVVYQAYDVTAEIKSGKNAVGALLAPGWYSTPLQWFRQGYNYGKTPPALRAQLRIEYKDGSVDWVMTDEKWKADISPILFAEIYDGETYDARKVQPNWNTAAFDDKRWKSAELVEPKETQIVWQYFQPIRAEKSLDAKKVTNPSPGGYIFDFEQNLSGVAHIRAQGTAGTDVKLRFAEIVNPDGTLYTDNLRTAKATDHFILSGSGVEEFETQFTFHGFRYAELTGLPTKPDASAMSALVIHTDAAFAAQLKTGNEMINQLWANILWGQRSNFVGVPTDCPQRDERLGWMADAQVFWRTAAYNMDLAAFSRKYAGDMRGSQAGTSIYGIFSPGTVRSVSGSGAGWSDAGVVIPWTSWLQTGDTSMIEQNWAAMETYLNAVDAKNPDGLWIHESGIPFGDWLSPEGRTNYTLIATAYWAYDVTLMKQMAHATGRTQDEEKYAQQFDKIRAAFEKKFVHDDGYVAGADNTPSPFGQINNPDAK